jgi:N12 class adenine-specific DNA methylase
MNKIFILPPNWIESHKTISGPFKEFVKAMNMAGHGMVATLKPATKKSGQVAKYHAMIGEISHQIGGDLANAEDAKRILISAFRIDTLRLFPDEWARFGDLRMGRGLRGEVVLMGVQSREFCTTLRSAFIEWLYAFGTEAGVIFTERVIDPETGEIVNATRAPKREGIEA